MSARAVSLVSLVSAVAACGYAPMHGGAAAEHFHVHLGESRVPDAVASDEVVAGAREELARAGTLAAGDGYPRVEIEIVRADEVSEGIAAAPLGALGSGAEGADRLGPESRATRVGMVARAWVQRAPAGERERDTGDVRAFETVAVADDARAATFRHSDALRVAGRRVGKRLASRILGVPSASDE